METPPDLRKQDRRKHVRFAMDDSENDLEVLVSPGETPQGMACELRNLSFSGMCFTSQQELDQDRDYAFRIRVKVLQGEPFSAKAEIRWKKTVAEGRYIYGAMFRESSKGWLSSARG